MRWYLAPSLSRLRDEVNKRWPKRSKASDGTKGDPAHAARASDHNPNRRGSVNAIDLTNNGINVDLLVSSACKHPATAYVISRGVIRSRTYGFRARRYTGSNPHNTHVHVSIQQTVTAEWHPARWFQPTYTRVIYKRDGKVSSAAYYVSGKNLIHIKPEHFKAVAIGAKLIKVSEAQWKQLLKTYRVKSSS